MEDQRDVTTTTLPDEPPLNLPELIASYSDRLLRSAYLMCGHSSNAQDIVQETFCRALTALPNFRQEAGVYTWLFSIMRNVYLNQCRHERRFLRFLTLQPRTLHVEGKPVEQWEQQNAAMQVVGILQRLPVKQREVIILRFVNGLKIVDIARVLSLPEGTVKSRLYKAGNRLQSLIAKGGRSLSVCEEVHEL